MSGLLFLGVIGLLAYLAWRLSGLIVRRVSNRWQAKGLQIVLTVFLMSLLVVDELIGGYQFRQLCKQNAVLKIDPEKAKGRTVKVARATKQSNLLANTAVPIYTTGGSLVDVQTGEEIVTTAWNSAEGGWLIRTLGISGSNTPLVIRPSTCYSSMGSREIAQLYGMHLEN